MATTEPSAIRTALETLIAAEDPDGTTYGNDAYTVASDSHGWDERPDSDKDREFTITDIDPGTTDSIGLHTEAIYRGAFSVVIGHVKGGDIGVAESRRDRDIRQIARLLEEDASRPSGVCLMNYTNRSIEDDGEHWKTTMSFELTYLGNPSA